MSGDEAQEEIDQANQERKEFLGRFSWEELCQIFMVAQFMKEIFRWARVAWWSAGDASYIVGFDDLALSCGPEAILQCYKDQSADLVVSLLEGTGFYNLSLLNGYISFPISQIQKERNIDPIPDVYKPTILDVVCGENEQCSRCHTEHGFDLWNESNWSLLRGHLTPSNILSHLKGRLSANHQEVNPLRMVLLDDDFCMADLMSELYDIKISDYDNWDKQDLLCLSCVEQIFKCHLHLWALERKRQEGQPILQDCWYGYNCRTQTHKVEHAKKLNHLCDPIRGDK